jgi:sirohydrochlorin cobaltochelatase
MRGLLVIGHGSRRDEANATVRQLAQVLADEPSPGTDGTAGPDGTSGPGRGWSAVEPAFLDVVAPDIATGYAALADAGCTEIVAHPFFLFDGAHTSRDIPAALAAAQAEHPGTRWALTAPLGLHPGVVTAVRARIANLPPPPPTATPAGGHDEPGARGEPVTPDHRMPGLPR